MFICSSIIFLASIISCIHNQIIEGIMLNHLELFWLPVIETFPAFRALLYFSSPYKTKIVYRAPQNSLILIIIIIEGIANALVYLIV